MFSKIFKGRDDAFGQFTISGKVADKVRGRAWTVSDEKLSAKHYNSHLKGKQGLGIVPITKDAYCYWGAIDVDDYKVDLASLEKKIGDLPLVLCRTKSGGAHLYLFCDGDPFPAEMLIKKLFEMAFYLGYPKHEIFPKQSKFDRESDIGNWINLPYYKAEETDRYAIKDGAPLSLDEFYALVDSKKITIEELAKTKCEANEDFNDAPPCLQYLTSIGITKGYKDLGLYNFAVFFKKKFPGSWEEKLDAFNQKYVRPPAASSTIAKVVKPQRKKDVFYKCKQEPLLSYCNKDACSGRKYGIESDGTPNVLLGNLTKIMTYPIVWNLNVDGKKIELTTQDLLDQRKFRLRCVECVNKVPKIWSQPKWDKLIQKLLDDVEIIAAPEDAGPEGQFYFWLKIFCTERPQGDTIEGLLQHKAYTDEKEDKTMFRSPDLLLYLKQQKFTDFKQHKVFSLIRDIGGESITVNVKGMKFRVWQIPRDSNVQVHGFNVPQCVKDDEF